MKYVMPSFLRNFKCLEEGYCCHRWNISVTPKELNDILANLKKIKEEDRPLGCGFDIRRDDKGNITDVYTKSHNDTCTFLVEKKCFLHMHFGMRGKPQICQSYPFYAIKTPQITYINVSMACPCSSRLLLMENNCTFINPARSIGHEFSLKANLEQIKMVKLSQKCSTNWDGFYFAHKKLLASYKNPSFIYKVHRFFSKSNQEYFTLEEIQKIFHTLSTEEDSYKISSENYLKTIVTSWLLWYQKNIEDDEVSPPILYFLDFLEIAEIDNIPVSASVKYKDLHCQNFKNEDCEALLHNYLFLLLFSSDFYYSYSFMDALAFMGLAVALVKFFSLATFGHSGENVSIDHLLDGVFVLEKFFFHSDYFNDLFEIKNSVPHLGLLLCDFE